ncbi:hypothetical protein D3C74_461070 [compost metagenome]
MAVQANLPVQCLQQQYTPGRGRAVHLFTAQAADLGTVTLKAGQHGLVAILGDAPGTSQQFDGVVIGQGLANPVTGLTVVDLCEDMYQLPQQRA